MQDALDVAQQRQFTIAGVGTWTLKRLGWRARLTLAGRAVELLGCRFDDAPQGYQMLALEQATIDLATVSAPPGWDWDTKGDATLLTHLYNEYSAWEDTFSRRVAAEQGDLGAATQSESTVLVPPNVPPPTP